MCVWIGIDGGGSKTAFAAVTPLGEVVAVSSSKGIDYNQDGIELCCQRLREGVSLLQKNVGGEKILGVGLGMPGYGEGGEEDEVAAARFRALFPGAETVVVNDAQVAWAGSLAMRPGINIVAGTGAIAFGRDGKGCCARAGGWSELFSDEGSGYWLGRLALGLFAKQSDGRLQKSALYELMKSRLKLNNDEDLCSLARNNIFRSRSSVASLQEVLAEAAALGDRSAVELYEFAAGELAACVHAVRQKLDFGEYVEASFSGGVFEAGELILQPFKKALGSGVHLTRPLLSPAMGAVLTAVEHLRPAELLKIRDGMLNSI